MSDRDETLLAMEAARVFALEHRVVEHQGGADEVDAVKRHVLPASGFFPLEHSRPLRAVSPAGYTAAKRFGEGSPPPLQCGRRVGCLKMGEQQRRPHC
jgi:hypothetical protein